MNVIVLDPDPQLGIYRDPVPYPNVPNPICMNMDPDLDFSQIQKWVPHIVKNFVSKDFVSDSISVWRQTEIFQPIRNFNERF